MKEIGGYMEFEHFYGEMLHGDAIKLNSGRNCLAYILKARNIHRIVLPYFICDCIPLVCQECNVSIRYYHINEFFCPEDVVLSEDEWLYVVNYYGQLSENDIRKYKNKYKKIILDNAHNYFGMPIEGIDTLYTCRKYFGVADGGILYTDKYFRVNERDISYDRMQFLLGRFEKTGSEFYSLSGRNEEHFYGEPIKKMSYITENILHGIDYKKVKQQRQDNFEHLHKALRHINLLNISVINSTFMYPLFINNGANIRMRLIEKNIFIPRLWPNIESIMDKNSLEYQFAMNILPIPCDQRYSESEMEYVIKNICCLIK